MMFLLGLVQVMRRGEVLEIFLISTVAGEVGEARDCVAQNVVEINKGLDWGVMGGGQGYGSLG